MEFIQEFISSGRSFVERQPVIALALGTALMAVIFTAVSQARDKERTRPSPNPWQAVGRQLTQFGWSVVLVGFLIGTAIVLKSYLNGALAEFRRTHGRVSEANYNAVQTIWGPEQNQQELMVEFGYDQEETERVEFDDPTKPAIIKKKMVHHTVPGNPFESARHEVTLRQNPRKKGSAIYPGYETHEHFTYKLNYPGDREAVAVIKFPMPSASMVANDLAVNLNGQSALGQLEIKDGTLLLGFDVKKGWTGDLDIQFKSRGVSFWYFQVSEARVIRDFTLTLHLPDLPKDRLNYPEGCMTPTRIDPTTDGRGCNLTYQLGNAVSSKGMGIALAQPLQPGKTMNAVLAESSTAWTLLFAALVSGLTLAGVRRAALFSILFGAAAAFGYGLLGNFHDIVFGFWGSAAVILLPLLVLMGWFVTQAVTGAEGKLLALTPLVFGGFYPCLAGVDSERQTLYLNICAFLFLALTAWQILRRTNGSISSATVAEPRVTAAA